MAARILMFLVIFNLIALTGLIGQTKTNDKIDKSRQTANKIASDSNNLAEVTGC